MFFFFFNDTATTEIYTLSLHDALPISIVNLCAARLHLDCCSEFIHSRTWISEPQQCERSEEHTSELQSHLNLVCRLLLEKKKKQRTRNVSCAAESATLHHALMRDAPTR